MSTPSHQQLEAFAAGIAKGLCVKHAAEAAGYSRTTTSYYKWPKRASFQARVAWHTEAQAEEASTTSLVPVIRRLLKGADAAVNAANGATLQAACCLLIEAARLKQLLPARVAAATQWPHLDLSPDQWLAAFAPREALPGPSD